ncbi:MAG TPA: periplasmic heavy metal sensor [Steroidobacteraceae bacterium]|nr:periplasmic heavy metal sensor [Steroidobacteraceae bacterium]
MNKRKLIPALCLAASLSGLAVYAATAPASDPSGGAHWRHHDAGLGPMGFVLHKLNLTADQKTKVKAIVAEQKSQFEALHTSSKANREALAKTAPTDPSYPGLVQTAQNNAAARIKLGSEIWTSVYTSVLTKPQQDAIPGIVAAAEAARASRMEAWKAQHSRPEPSTSD